MNDDPMKARARLSEQERIKLFTLLGQWARDGELQAIKVTEWFEHKLSAFGSDARREGMEAACRAMCELCAEGNAAELCDNPADGYVHKHVERDSTGFHWPCAASAIRAQIAEEAEHGG